MSATRFLLCVVCLAPIPLAAYPVRPQVRAQPANASWPPSPPSAPVRPITDTYYGTKVVDPYRYMENLADPEVQSWIKAQNDYTRAVLASLPGRQQLLKRIVELDESTSADVGSMQRLPGDLYLYTKLLAGEDTYKLYIRKGLTGEEKLLLDPEKVTLAGASRAKARSAPLCLPTTSST